jgi:hypothetical protein
MPAEKWSPSGTHLPKMSPPTDDATPKPPKHRRHLFRCRRIGPLLRAKQQPHRPAPRPRLNFRNRACLCQPSNRRQPPLAVGAIPDAAKAHALPPDSAAGDAAKPADKPRGRRGDEEGGAGRAPENSVAGPFAEYLRALTNLGRSKEVKAALQSVL